jgi:hypothetical protein
MNINMDFFSNSLSNTELLELAQNSLCAFVGANFLGLSSLLFLIWFFNVFFIAADFDANKFNKIVTSDTLSQLKELSYEELSLDSSRPVRVAR